MPAEKAKTSKAAPRPKTSSESSVLVPHLATVESLKRKRARLAYVDVVLDPEAAQPAAAAERAWSAAVAAAKAAPTDEAAQAEEGRLRAAMEDERRAIVEAGVLVRFELRSIGANEFDRLLLAHPPTKEERQESRVLGLDPPGFNGDTFPRALIAASLVSPSLTVEEVAALFDDPAWSKAELTGLFVTALTLNNS